MGKRYHPSLVVLPRQARLDRLVRVLPIAQAREANGITVQALAFEMYTTGFVVTFQAQSHGAVLLIDKRPTLTLDVTDDRERQYLALLYGASREGARNDWQWRLAYRCAPALDPRTEVLLITILAMEWQLPDPKRQIYVPVSTVAGPWAFEIPLSPSMDIVPVSP